MSLLKPTKQQREAGYMQMNRQLEQRAEERAHANSFPVDGKEAALFVQKALKPVLAPLSDHETAQAFIAELAAFVEKFAVKIEQVNASFSPLQKNTPGGIYRFGVKPGELSLLLRRGQFGPRLLVTLTFPVGSAASHRHARIENIIKELHTADEARKQPHLVTLKVPGSTDRGSTRGVSVEELKAQKVRRMEFCLSWLMMRHQRAPFNLGRAISALYAASPEMFPTRNYVQGALERMYKQQSPYLRPENDRRDGSYQLTEAGVRKAEELAKRAGNSAYTKEGLPVLTEALQADAASP